MEEEARHRKAPRQKSQIVKVVRLEGKSRMHLAALLVLLLLLLLLLLQVKDSPRSLQILGLCFCLN